MSANVELVRSIYAAWGRGDWSSVEWAHSETRSASLCRTTSARAARQADSRLGR
jgi:hypothetical protein